VKITGTVVVASRIEATLTAKGARCTIRKPPTFKLRPNRTIPVGPEGHEPAA
jgi:hypothetical protein